MAWNLPRIFGQKKKVDITKKSEEYKKQAKDAQKRNNSVIDIIAGKRSSKHTPGATSQKKEISTLIEKFKELSETVEIMEIEGKYSEKSIDTLKEQVDKVETARKELSNSLKALTDLPSNMVNMPQEQATLRAEVNKLKEENLILDKLEKKEKKDSKSARAIDQRKILNNEKITTKENQINNNDIAIQKFSTGGKVQELSENIKNNLIEFKREVSKLETMVESIEKGQDPKSPKSIVSKPPVELRPVRVASPPPGTIADKLGKALKEFEAQKNLRTLVKYIESDGVYEGSKEYLLKELDFLKKDLGVISDNELKKIQETLTNPKLTEEKFLQITNSLIETIDRDLESKNDKLAKPNAEGRQSFVEKEEKRKENKEEQFTTRL